MQTRWKRPLLLIAGLEGEYEQNDFGGFPDAAGRRYILESPR